MKKAFFINGGAGRVLCSLPALEHYVKNIDDDVVIISEGWTELFLASAIIRDKVYPISHKGLFDVIKDREIITPEPYRLNAYFNQKANLIQAFDMLINYDIPPSDVPTTKNFNFNLGKADYVFGETVIRNAKDCFKKDKVVVFQPFGSGVKQSEEFVYDESGRSFEFREAVRIVDELSEHYAIIMMSDFKPPINRQVNALIPDNVNMLQWMGIINSANYFIGCDSVGQHIANALNKPSTVVIGSTYPENISYPNNKNFKIFDLGKDKRRYSPIRITNDIMIERNNESLMSMDEKNFKDIIKSVTDVLGKTNKYIEKNQNNTTSCACNTPKIDPLIEATNASPSTPIVKYPNK